MLYRIIKEETFLLEENIRYAGFPKYNGDTLYNGIYKRLLFENGTITWECHDSSNTNFTHLKSNDSYWVMTHDRLEELYNKRLTYENRNLKIDEILK